MKLFRLRDVAGEAVQKPTVRAFGLEGFKNHRDGDGVRHKFAAIHVFLGLFAQFGAASHMFTEDGAGFDMREAESLFDERALRALAAAVGTEHKNIHGLLLWV